MIDGPETLKAATDTRGLRLNVVHAVAAFCKLDRVLHPRRRTVRGYQKCRFDYVTRIRCESMLMCLRRFINSPNRGFIKASKRVAKILGKGAKWHARKIRQWIRRYIKTGDLPVINLGHQNVLVLENEVVAGEIKLHLQSKGKYICAEDIVVLLNDASVRENLGIKKSITIQTARSWLRKMGYRWKAEPKGQYFDGHERPDVVAYRQNVFIPAWKSLEPFMVTWDDTTGALILPQLRDGQKEVIFWFHDESKFYAHDRQRIRWVHINERATPYEKGEGASLMVSDFISTKGFLQSRDG